MTTRRAAPLVVWVLAPLALCLCFHQTTAQCGCGGNHQPEWMQAPPPPKEEDAAAAASAGGKEASKRHHSNNEQQRRLESPSSVGAVVDDDHHHHDHYHNRHHYHDHPSATTFGSKFVGEVLTTIPWVTLGVLISSVLSVSPSVISVLRTLFLSRNNNINQSSSVLDLLGAALLGLATPLCSCGALPLASGLLHSGIPLPAVVVFLTASQSAGLDSVAITWGLLGGEAALARLVGALLLAVATGLAVRGVSNSKTTTTTTTTIHTVSNEKNNGPKMSSISDSISKTILAFFAACVDTAGEVFPSVFFGLALSTAIVQLLPQLAITYAVLTNKSSSDIGSDGMAKSPILELGVRVLVLLSALPLQLCEHSTVTFAAAISQAGGSLGLAFAFLLAAPSTNLASLLLLVDQQSTMIGAKRNKAHWSVMPRVALALVGSALALSYLIDWAGMDLLVEKEARLEGGGMVVLPPVFVANAKYLWAALTIAGIGKRAYRALV